MNDQLSLWSTPPFVSIVCQFFESLWIMFLYFHWHCQSLFLLHILLLPRKDIAFYFEPLLFQLYLPASGYVVVQRVCFLFDAVYVIIIRRRIERSKGQNECNNPKFDFKQMFLSFQIVLTFPTAAIVRGCSWYYFYSKAHFADNRARIFDFAR